MIIIYFLVNYFIFNILNKKNPRNYKFIEISDQVFGINHFSSIIIMRKILFFVAALIFLAQLYAQNLDSGLVVHYPFENNLDDTVGGRNGNSINGIVSYVPGVSGMALQMPNITTPLNDNHRIEITPWSGISNNSSFTVSSWINIAGELSNLSEIITYQDGSFTHGFRLFYNPTTPSNMVVNIIATGSISAILNNSCLNLAVCESYCFFFE